MARLTSHACSPSALAAARAARWPVRARSVLQQRTPADIKRRSCLCTKDRKTSDGVQHAAGHSWERVDVACSVSTLQPALGKAQEDRLPCRINTGGTIRLECGGSQLGCSACPVLYNPSRAEYGTAALAYRLSLPTSPNAQQLCPPQYVVFS